MSSAPADNLSDMLGEGPALRKRRGRRAAWTSAVAAAGILALAGIASRDLIAERWLIWRLQSADEATRLDAAVKLADRGSIAAVPHLLRIMVEGGREAAYEETIGSSSGTGRARRISLTPIAHAISRAGPEALLAIDAAADRIGLAPDPRNKFDIPWVLCRFSFRAERSCSDGPRHPDLYSIARPRPPTP